MAPDIDTIFFPDGVDSFVDEALGRHALYLRGVSDKFGDVVSWKVLNHLLAYGGLAYPRLRLISGSSDLPATHYSRTGPDGYPHLLVAELASFLREGATLAISGMERLHEPVSGLCRTLERKLGIPLQAELYASWNDNPRRGFQWNDHETLVFQISGEKNWCLFQPTAYHPTAHFSQPQPNRVPNWEGPLLAGDLLYIPRGWWYSDSPLGEPSLYLTVTFSNPRGTDMLWRLCQRADLIDVLRMDVPRFATLEDQSSYLSCFQKEVADLCGRPGLFLGLVKDLQQASGPWAHFGLPWSVAANPLPPAEGYILVSLLRFPSAEMIGWRESDGSIRILHNNQVHTLDDGAARVLDLIGRCPDLTVRDLLDRCGENMPPVRVLEHLSGLIKMGVVSARAPD